MSGQRLWRKEDPHFDSRLCNISGGVRVTRWEREEMEKEKRRRDKRKEGERMSVELVSINLSSFP